MWAGVRVERKTFEDVRTVVRRAQLCSQQQLLLFLSSLNCSLRTKCTHTRPEGRYIRKERRVMNIRDREMKRRRRRWPTFETEVRDLDLRSGSCVYKIKQHMDACLRGQCFLLVFSYQPHLHLHLHMRSRDRQRLPRLPSKTGKMLPHTAFVSVSPRS